MEKIIGEGRDRLEAPGPRLERRWSEARALDETPPPEPHYRRL